VREREAAVFEEVDHAQVRRASRDRRSPSVRDGSPATDWEPASAHATLTARIAGLAGPFRTVTLRWGRQWPGAPAPNVPPPPGPVTVLRPASYTVFVSSNGRSWRRVAVVSGHTRRVLDTLHLNGVNARFVRIRVTASARRSSRCSRS